mmetsp:Transcript_44937/g.94289  ORF Transcript_44937/g.94289 Transcript_44937/m.94289 type:complete len:103 (-) Transcript_44937:914-1222(-)
MEALWVEGGGGHLFAPYVIFLLGVVRSLGMEVDDTRSSLGGIVGGGIFGNDKRSVAIVVDVGEGDRFTRVGIVGEQFARHSGMEGAAEGGHVGRGEGVLVAY